MWYNFLIVVFLFQVGLAWFVVGSLDGFADFGFWLV